MKRNCSLELRLETPSVFSNSSHYYNSMSDMEGGMEKHPLTIFYNGRVVSCDATELKARAIIFLASREMEEKSSNSEGGSNTCSPDNNSPVCFSPTITTSVSLSMKRSLQRFLEKRKIRAQSMSPYPAVIRHHMDHN